MLSWRSLRISLATLISSVLFACAATSASDSEPVVNRAIDWDRASSDAAINHGESRNRGTQSLAVPVLLPPVRLDNGAAGTWDFEAPKILFDSRGYSAVIKAAQLTVLIDASNQTYQSAEAGNTAAPKDFNGRLSAIDGGSAMSIGRYGALYAIQFLCADRVRLNCIDAQRASLFAQALVVHVAWP